MKLIVEHIAIVAKDPVSLKHWYERVLGAKPVFDNGQTPPTCLLSLGHVWFEIYAADAALPDTRNNKLAGFRHLALRTDSLDAAKAELEQRGVRLLLTGHQPLMAALKALKDTYAHLQAGGSVAELKPNIATGAELEALLRGNEFKGWQEMHLGKV